MWILQDRFFQLQKPHLNLEIKVKKMNLMWTLSEARNVFQLIEKLNGVQFVQSNETVKERLTLRVESTLTNLIREAAELNNMSVNNYITQALVEKLATEAYLKKLEAELDNYSLIATENKCLPILNPETCMDIEKFHQSQQRYKERKNGSKFRAFKLKPIVT